jgi:hypothetical protein
MLIIYSLSKYTDKKTNQEKTSFKRIGAAFKNRDGSLTLELEAFPVSGRAQVRDEDKDKAERARREAERQRSGDAAEPGAEDDIPF